MEKLLAERPDDRHFWDMSNDFMHGSYVPVNGRTMLETSTLAASTFEILANGVAELSRLNVKTASTARSNAMAYCRRRKPMISKPTCRR